MRHLKITAYSALFLVSILGLASCAPDKVPDAWAGIDIHLSQPDSQIQERDSTTTYYNLSDRVELGTQEPESEPKPLSDLDSLTLTTNCEDRDGRRSEFTQALPPLTYYEMASLLPPASLVGFNQQSSQRRLSCQFNFTLKNQVGSTRKRSLEATIKLTAPESAETFLETSQLQFNIENISTIKLKKLRPGEQYLAVCLDGASQWMRTPERNVRDLLENLDFFRAGKNGVLNYSSPKQTCRILLRNSNYEITYSQPFEVEIPFQGILGKLSARVNDNLETIATPELHFFDITFENTSDSKITYRLPRFRDELQFSFINSLYSRLFGGAYIGASVARSIPIKTSVSKKGEAYVWSRDDLTYVTLTHGAQVIISVSGSIPVYCGSDQEFLGIDFNPPTKGPLIIERSTLGIRPGDEQSFQTLYSSEAQFNGAVRTTGTNRLTYYVQWKYRNTDPGPNKGNARLYDRCWN